MTDKDRKPSAAILISGSGSNLQAFIDRERENKLPFRLALVVSNRADAFGLERARKAGIPTHTLDNKDYEDRESFDDAIHAVLQDYEPDIIILAGFMRILSAGFVARYAGRILNIHPSLLPAYPGLHTHQRALDAADQWHGCTVHFVTAELDAGAPIPQGRVPVLSDDDTARLSARVQTMEHIIFPEAASWLAGGRVTFTDGHAQMDGKPLLEPVVFDWKPAGQ